MINGGPFAHRTAEPTSSPLSSSSSSSLSHVSQLNRRAAHNERQRRRSAVGGGGGGCSAISPARSQKRREYDQQKQKHCVDEDGDDDDVFGDYNHNNTTGAGCASDDQIYHMLLFFEKHFKREPTYENISRTVQIRPALWLRLTDELNMIPNGVSKSYVDWQLVWVQMRRQNQQIIQQRVFSAMEIRWSRLMSVMRTADFTSEPVSSYSKSSMLAKRFRRTEYPFKVIEVVNGQYVLTDAPSLEAKAEPMFEIGNEEDSLDEIAFVRRAEPEQLELMLCRFEQLYLKEATVCDCFRTAHIEPSVWHELAQDLNAIGSAIAQKRRAEAIAQKRRSAADGQERRSTVVVPEPRSAAHWQKCWLSEMRCHQNALRITENVTKLTAADHRKSRLMSIMRSTLDTFWFTVELTDQPGLYCLCYLPPILPEPLKPRSDASLPRANAEQQEHIMRFFEENLMDNMSIESFERPVIAADFWPRLVQAYYDQQPGEPHQTVEHWQACWFTMVRDHQSRLRCVYDTADLTDDDYRKSRLMSVLWFDVEKWRNEVVPMLWLTVVPIEPRGYCKGYLPPSFTASNVAGGPPPPVEENGVVGVPLEALMPSPPVDQVEAALSTIVEDNAMVARPSVYKTVAAVESFQKATTVTPRATPAAEITAKSSSVSFVKPMPPAPNASQQAKVTPPSRAQLEHIISYFEQQFMRGDNDSEFPRAVNVGPDMWHELQQQLNAMPNGVQKTSQDWSQWWNRMVDAHQVEIRYKTKLTAEDYRKSRLMTVMCWSDLVNIGGPAYDRWVTVERIDGNRYGKSQLQRLSMRSNVDAAIVGRGVEKDSSNGNDGDGDDDDEDDDDDVSVALTFDQSEIIKIRTNHDTTTPMGRGMQQHMHNDDDVGCFTPRTEFSMNDNVTYRDYSSDEVPDDDDDDGDVSVALSFENGIDDNINYVGPSWGDEDDEADEGKFKKGGDDNTMTGFYRPDNHGYNDDMDEPLPKQSSVPEPQQLQNASAAAAKQSNNQNSTNENAVAAVVAANADDALSPTKRIEVLDDRVIVVAPRRIQIPRSAVANALRFNVVSNLKAGSLFSTDTTGDIAGNPATAMPTMQMLALTSATDETPFVGNQNVSLSPAIQHQHHQQHHGSAAEWPSIGVAQSSDLDYDIVPTQSSMFDTAHTAADVEWTSPSVEVDVGESTVPLTPLGFNVIPIGGQSMFASHQMSISNTTNVTTSTTATATTSNDLLPPPAEASPHSDVGELADNMTLDWPADAASRPASPLTASMQSKPDALKFIIESFEPSKFNTNRNVPDYGGGSHTTAEGGGVSDVVTNGSLPSGSVLTLDTSLAEAFSTNGLRMSLCDSSVKTTKPTTTSSDWQPAGRRTISQDGHIVMCGGATEEPSKSTNDANNECSTTINATNVTEESPLSLAPTVMTIVHQQATSTPMNSAAPMPHLTSISKTTTPISMAKTSLTSTTTPPTAKPTSTKSTSCNLDADHHKSPTTLPLPLPTPTLPPPKSPAMSAFEREALHLMRDSNQIQRQLLECGQRRLAVEEQRLAVEQQRLAIEQQRRTTTTPATAGTFHLPINGGQLPTARRS